MKSFADKTAASVLWSVAGQVGRQTGVIACNVILARLLTPYDFGLTATILIFVNFAVVVAEQGFSAALIQKSEITEAHRSSIWWVNVGAGVAMTSLFLASAPLIGRMYHEPALVPLMRVISLLFVVHSLGITHGALLARELEFSRLARVETAGAWAGALAAIGLAFAGAGPWAIVAQSVVTSAIGSVALWRMSGWRPKAIFDLRAVRELAGFSTNSFVTEASNYWVRNVDNILIGLLLGQAPLGVYTRAYAVMLFPLNRITRVLQRVMLPSFSIIQDDHARVASLFQRMTRVVALATFPLMLGVLACARDFTFTLFGPQWGAMIPVLRVLVGVGLIQSVTGMLGSLYSSRNRTDLRLRVQLPLHAIEVLGIVIGLHWGILGVAAGYAIASVVTAPVTVYFACRLVGLTVADYFVNLAGVFACAAASALTAGALSAGLPADWPAFARLGVEVGAAALVYWSLLKAFSVKGYADFTDQLSRRVFNRAVEPAS
ncbi:MAG: MOP flippase family protein [Elusimicrobia bacterium]|nr:MOP flippase family protein [Elusimicrobiota bacterium]